MKKRFPNPFTPNRPVHDPERFFGRLIPVNEMIESLYQIKNGNPLHSIVTGDRGVGKSSLLTQIYMTANGNNDLTDRLKIDRGTEKFDFISVWHDVDSTQDVSTLAYAILSQFEPAFKKFIPNFSLDIDLLGFGNLGIDNAKDKGQVTMPTLITEFVSRMKKVSQEAKREGKDGVLIFIDELDRIQANSMIASFFKLVTERLSREGYGNIGFMCAGITGAIQKLEDEHQSIKRTFHDIPLSTFSAQECAMILLDGFQKVQYESEINDLDKRAYKVTYGMPEPIHLLGSQILAVDEDGILRDEDFDAAIRKIVDEPRKNALRDLLKKAGTGNYQKILEAMSTSEKEVVPLDHIARYIGKEQSQFSTNMGTLVDREILTKPLTGYYQFADPMLKEYIRINGTMNFDD